MQMGRSRWQRQEDKRPREGSDVKISFPASITNTSFPLCEVWGLIRHFSYAPVRLARERGKARVSEREKLPPNKGVSRLERVQLIVVFAREIGHSGMNEEAKFDSQVPAKQ